MNKKQYLGLVVGSVLIGGLLSGCNDGEVSELPSVEPFNKDWSVSEQYAAFNKQLDATHIKNTSNEPIKLSEGHPVYLNDYQMVGINLFFELSVVGDIADYDPKLLDAFILNNKDHFCFGKGYNDMEILSLVTVKFVSYIPAKQQSHGLTLSNVCGKVKS